MHADLVAGIVSWIILGNFGVGFMSAPTPLHTTVSRALETKTTRTPPHTQIPQILLTPTAPQTPTEFPTPTPTADFTPTETPTPTLPQTATPPSSVSAIDGFFTTYANQYSVDIGLLRKIASCESGYNTSAQGAGGLYIGMFQFSEGAWTTARSSMGQNTDPSLRTNPEEAIKTAAFLIANHQTNLWPTCGH